MTWRNGFLLLIPILVWNLLFTSRLPLENYSQDENVAAWILGVETVLRLAAFGMPLFLTLRLDSVENKLGLALYLVCASVYFAAWLIEIYAPDSALAAQSAVILAPYYTPLVFLAGIGLLGSSYLYVGLAVTFIFVHTYHGLLSFGYLSPAGF